jgi:hypothetical protein
MRRIARFAAIGLLALGPLVPRAEAQGMCLIGVSKDLCGGALSGGNWSPFKCSGPHDMKCSTLTGTGVAFGTPIKSTSLPCDEAKELNGNLRFVINTRVRQQPPLTGEGSFEGSFDFLQNGGIVAKGKINATLGVGTHRPACDGKCGKDCEKCYAASFNPSAKAWTIHTEGFMDGQVSAGIYKGCRIRWSFEGSFNAPGDDKGPTPPGQGWKFCGNVDGVLECPC